MTTQFEIQVEYESLKEITLVVLPTNKDDENYWRLEWNRDSDLLTINTQGSCDEPLPKGAMEEGLIILNERFDILYDEDQEDEEFDEYKYNGVRRSDFF